MVNIMIIQDKSSRSFLMRIAGVIAEPGKQLFIDAGKGSDMTVTAAYQLGDVAVDMIEKAHHKGGAPDGYISSLSLVANAVESNSPWDRALSEERAMERIWDAE
jgi:hypothetical protein